MKKALTKIENKLYYFIDGVRVEGIHKDIRGNVSGIRGDVSYITGNVSDIRGNVSDIRGNVSGIRGDVNDCGITEEDRKKGIDISELIK